jgi:hypothetical protein
MDISGANGKRSEGVKMYRDSEIGVVFHHGVLTRSPFALRLIQLISLLFAGVYALLGARLLIEYVRAPSVPFVQWISEWTNRVYLPLRAFIPNGHDRAGHPIAWAVLAAIAAFAIVHALLVGSLRRLARPRIEEL